MALTRSLSLHVNANKRYKAGRGELRGARSNEPSGTQQLPILSSLLAAILGSGLQFRSFLTKFVTIFVHAPNSSVFNSAPLQFNPSGGGHTPKKIVLLGRQLFLV